MPWKASAKGSGRTRPVPSSSGTASHSNSAITQAAITTATFWSLPRRFRRARRWPGARDALDVDERVDERRHLGSPTATAAAAGSRGSAPFAKAADGFGLPPTGSPASVKAAGKGAIVSSVPDTEPACDSGRPSCSADAGCHAAGGDAADPAFRPSSASSGARTARSSATARGRATVSSTSSTAPGSEISESNCAPASCAMGIERPVDATARAGGDGGDLPLPPTAAHRSPRLAERLNEGAVKPVARASDAGSPVSCTGRSLRTTRPVVALVPRWRRHGCLSAPGAPFTRTQRRPRRVFGGKHATINATRRRSRAGRQSHAHTVAQRLDHLARTHLSAAAATS
mmetsp:Transcript_5225/g.18796  ORF Transcript_5225/g.18796 Transcript_5225/m.18796 type:complete len:343 (-) Transcript_5225:11-1039(-)